MAYQSGQIIQATSTPLDDFNELAALINEVYGDAHSGDHAVATGSFGYGQSPEIATVSAGDVITAVQWTEIFSSLAKCANHQGTAVGAIPAFVTIGDIVDAFDSPSGLNDLVAAIRNNKTTVDPSEATIAEKINVSFPPPWTVQATHEFEVTFTDDDHARHFFNSGGEIRWHGAYVAGVPEESGEEADWTQALSDIGVLAFSYNNSSSDAGATSGIGYYDVTTSYQELLNKSLGGGGGSYYTNESIKVNVMATNASLNVLRFQVLFTTDSLADRTLNGTLTSIADQKISSGNITIVEPTYNSLLFTGS